MLIIYIYVALGAYNTGYLTLPMGSVECVVDEHANVAVVGGKWRKEKRRRGERVEWRTYWGVGTDAVLDVPVGGVCEVLYGEGRGLDEESEEEG
jgi:phosphatidylinositol N-acetylglucosaminyltransferase subunit P